MPGIVNSMLPWLVFAPLLDWMDGDYLKAALLALVVSLAASASRLRKGYAVDWTVACSLVLVSATAATSSGTVVLKYWPLIMPLGLSLMCWVSIALSRPFTTSYAKADTPPEHWDSPHFLRINMQISTIWGAVFSMMLALSVLTIAFHLLWPIFLIAKYLLIISGMVASRLLPNFYFARLEAKADA